MYNFNLILIYNFRFNVTPIMSGGSMSTNLKLYNFDVDKDFSFVSYPQFYEKKEKNLFLQINSKVRNFDKITVNKTIAPHFLKKSFGGDRQRNYCPLYSLCYDTSLCILSTFRERK